MLGEHVVLAGELDDESAGVLEQRINVRLEPSIVLVGVVRVATLVLRVRLEGGCKRGEEVESVEVTRWRGWHCVHRDSKWAPLVRDSSFSIHFDLAWSYLAHRAGQPFSHSVFVTC